MRLLELEHFAPIFEPLSGVVGVVDGLGNPGDWMIYQATRELLDAFDKRWITLNLHSPEPVDVILLFGGGNMGDTYNECVQMRRIARSLGKPTVLLPQSFKAVEKNFTKAFIRESYSNLFCEDGILAPDLALGLDWTPTTKQPEEEQGTFLRTDREGIHTRYQEHSRGDPALFTFSVEEYLDAVTDFQHIVTDRLHFAIAALMQKRHVTLLPNSYHKNRGVWETWLKDLGCWWANSPIEVL